MGSIAQCTINATLVTINGAPGSGSIRLTLAGYGLNTPVVMGSGTLAALSYTGSFSATSNTVSIPVVGNDVISPAHTFYLAQLLDARGHVIASTQYRFVGQGALDISLLVPIDPAKSEGIFYVANLNNKGPKGDTGLPGSVSGALVGMVPVGPIDGTNEQFLVTGNPSLSILFRNGLFQMPANAGLAAFDYTLVGDTITYNSPPQVGDNHYYIGLTPSDSLTPPAPGYATLVLRDLSTGVVSLLQSTNGSIVAIVAPGATPQTVILTDSGDPNNVLYFQLFLNEGTFALSPVTSPTGAQASYSLGDTNNGHVYSIAAINGEVKITQTS